VVQATKLEIQIEAQANASASFLLMPLDDFREQIRSKEINRR
jgi:Zn-dependent peptidase ImmA (M78 family)